jgi:pheromone shutdown protein TraB
MTGAGSDTSDNRREMLHATARIAALVGAIVSIALMLWVGRRNSSWLLLLLFAIWVSAPFVALAAAQMTLARPWSALTRAAMRGLTIAVAIGTLATYAWVAFGPPRAQPAFAFIVTPPLSMLVVVIGLGLTALWSRARSRP